jgi:hypothetical protein
LPYAMSRASMQAMQGQMFPGGGIHQSAGEEN